jgi:LysR family glycine cleavage system transcriptional activator
MRRLPPLTALRAFAAFGHEGNIRKAAEQLNVTPAAVHYQIRQLERHLGVELVLTTASGAILTRAGRDFHHHVAEAFDKIFAAVRMVESQTPEKVIRVHSLPSFASCWLVPRLMDFYAHNPGIEVEVNTVGDLGFPTDLVRSTADVAIRVGADDHAWPGLVAQKLAHEDMFPACAPNLLSGPKALRTPADLAHHPLLIVSRRHEGWPEWIEAADAAGANIGHIDPDRGLKFDTIQLATTAAVEGIGVVIGRTPLVNHYLETGLLVEPFKLRVTSKNAYWLVYQKEAISSEPIRLFCHWLFHALKQDTPAKELS